MKTCFSVILFSALFLFPGCTNRPDKKDNLVLLSTTLGNIKIRLYDETPVHRDNFLRLVRIGAYDGILFHRVISNFMIQAGDMSTRVPGVLPGSDTLTTYTLPAEIVPGLFHKKGALAAARTGNDVNPEIRSSGTQFYIVHGTIYTDPELSEAERRINNNLNQLLFIRLIRQTEDSIRASGQNLTASEIQEKATIRKFEILQTRSGYTIPEEQRIVYKTIGGVPRLDQTYTVFGEVTEGLEVVDKIASVGTDDRDKPLSDVRIINAKIVTK